MNTSASIAANVPRLAVYRWSTLDDDLRATLLSRPARPANQADVVARMIEQVRADGDVALCALTLRYDGVELAMLEVDIAAIDAAKPDKAKILFPQNRADLEKNPAKYEGTAWYAGGIMLIGELVE